MNQIEKIENEQIIKLINELSNEQTRESALSELSIRRDEIADLAILLWYSFGSVSILLNEIAAAYSNINLSSPINSHISSRICNALALLQCIATHDETRALLIDANIPLILYPFLRIQTNFKEDKSFEYLRLTSLGVIGALVKKDNQQVINFLLSTEIIPLCLKIMESSSINELSKTVATFILQRILMDDNGLAYICQTFNRFSHVVMVLSKMVAWIAKEQSARLLKHVIRCYLRLCDNLRAKEALRQIIPDQLKDLTFANLAKEDKPYRELLKILDT